ncbi:MAG: hypothetical protein EOP08_04450, partial [Proteobacteria bacterium]
MAQEDLAGQRPHRVRSHHRLRRRRPQGRGLGRRQERRHGDLVHQRHELHHRARRLEEHGARARAQERARQGPQGDEGRQGVGRSSRAPRQRRSGLQVQDRAHRRPYRALLGQRPGAHVLRRSRAARWPWPRPPRVQQLLGHDQELLRQREDHAALIVRGLALLVLLGVVGCTPLRYVTQAAAGQAELLDGKRDIDEILREGGQDPRTRRLLSRVPGIKAFGERHGLRHTRNYETFVDLHRDAVVWVVSASAPLEFRSVAWKFPVTGSITYLGWFHRPEADTFAEGLRKKGLDVDVRGASAYSTLGWFDDPVLSSMLWPGDEALGELADVILHESLHATYFVPGQSILNESVANFVGNSLAVEYLDQVAGSCANEKTSYLKIEAEAGARSRAMKAAFFELRTLYASAAPDAVKLQKKAGIL